MEKQNKLSAFWFGFLLGGGLTATAAFFLGTKQGRKTLKKVLELSENMEDTLEELVDEYGDEIKEKGLEIADELKKNSKNLLNTPESHSLHSLLDKMKVFSPATQKKVKRFFVKEGKILEDDKNQPAI